MGVLPHRIPHPQAQDIVMVVRALGQGRGGGPREPQPAPGQGRSGLPRLHALKLQDEAPAAAPLDPFHGYRPRGHGSRPARRPAPPPPPPPRARARFCPGGGGRFPPPPWGGFSPPVLRRASSPRGAGWPPSG